MLRRRSLVIKIVLLGSAVWSTVVFLLYTEERGPPGPGGSGVGGVGSGVGGGVGVMGVGAPGGVPQFQAWRRETSTPHHNVSAVKKKPAAAPEDGEFNIIIRRVISGRFIYCRMKISLIFKNFM